MTLRSLAVAVASSALLASCCRSPHHRIDLPATGSDAYRQIVTQIERESHVVDLALYPRKLRLNDPATAIFIRLGYVRREGSTFAPTALARRHAVVDLFDETSAFGTVAIGEQRVERLTFASTDDSTPCTPYDDAADDYGYVARVVSLNGLGRALLAEHLLVTARRVIGYASPTVSWDGTAPLDREWSFNARDHNFGADFGEQIGVASSF